MDQAGQSTGQHADGKAHRLAEVLEASARALSRTAEVDRALVFMAEGRAVAAALIVGG